MFEFFKEGEDPFYPQGLKVDDMVDNDLGRLRSDYPEIEFFTYDISNPGNAQASDELDRGQYGTLAAQLNVGFTPFVAMLAPRGDEYIIENLFQGYIDREVLDQALYDLSRADVRGDASDVDLTLEGIELTESGGGIEYFTVLNEGDEEINLQGYSLRVVDSETGEVNDNFPGAEINDDILVAPGESVSVGRAFGIVDADGNVVAGAFEGGGGLRLEPGDQVALLDGGGAVVSIALV